MLQFIVVLYPVNRGRNTKTRCYNRLEEDKSCVLRNDVLSKSCVLQAKSVIFNLETETRNTTNNHFHFRQLIFDFLKVTVCYSVFPDSTPLRKKV